MSEQSVPQEPDILIQDTEDVPQMDAPTDSTAGFLCQRCDVPTVEGEVYCEACKQKMQKYPFRHGTFLGVVLCMFVCLFAVFVLGTNVLIAHSVRQGDKALAANDLKGCYTAYGNAYSVAEQLNNLLVPNLSKTFFTNGSRTLQKQIIALDRLNGAYQAGQMIEQYFSGHVPHALESIYAEYNGISAFVTDMQAQITAYKDSLPSGASGDYDAMLALVDKCAEKHPETPAYMVDYYRFSVSYSDAKTDTARTCAHLDKLIAEAPDALWLYASEGIRAYNANEEYEKSLSICNALMKRDATNSATVSYTMTVLRLLGKLDEALAVYDRAASMGACDSEIERQRAIVLMMQGDCKTAQSVLVDSYSAQTSILEHIATIVVCAWQNKDTETYNEYKTLLDTYASYEDVDAFVAGDCTLEDIFLSGGGEIQ